MTSTAGLLFKAYLGASLAKRIVIGVTLAVLVNAIYCLTYRYASGNPATLFEAFSWGIINIAPWLIAFEIARSSRNFIFIAALFAGALIGSLCLEAALYQSWPTGFDLVRRIPAAILTAAAIGIFQHFERRNGQMREPASAETGTETESEEACDWAMSAGNYVEVSRIGGSTKLVRSSLAQFIKDAGPDFTRVHRRYAVSLSAVKRMERSYVYMKDGTRIPMGDKYRAASLNRFSVADCRKSDAK